MVFRNNYDSRTLRDTNVHDQTREVGLYRTAFNAFASFITHRSDLVYYVNVFLLNNNNT